MDYRIFPKEYYSVCSENFRKRRSNRFCNGPLSPVQVKNVSSPDTQTNVSVNSEVTEIISAVTTSDSNPRDILISSSSSNDDSDEDPDFIPGTSDSESDSEVLREDIVSLHEFTTKVETVTEVDGQQLITNQLESYSFNNLGEYKENGEKRKGNKKKDFCLFCESYVLNFARHVVRNHSIEKEVQQINSFSSEDKTRKKLLCELRRKGNFLNASCVQKPVRRPCKDGNILPCTKCMGFFSTKQLSRHRKACVGESDGKHQSKGQNLLLKDLRVDSDLRAKVFPRMRPDEISMVAKTDDLICAFGARYFKSHREKHFVNVTSRKMRELARLLIEVKKIKTSVKNLFEVLKPENFGILVTATKIVAQYNEETEFFKSATTALNLGTAIKQCCQVAIIFVLKRKQTHSTISAATAEADLKTLMQLIDSEWRFEISTQASNDLNMKKWNKVTIVPLASDLKIIKDYLIAKANAVVNALTVNSKNREAYITLLETVFCRVLLLNRRRPGELQRLPLHIYENLSNHPNNYEEFGEIISSSERFLLHIFKRVVIRGKRGRGVPVLFSTDVQEHIELVLKYRANFLKKDNIFLFGNPNTLQPICGYKIISKYAKLSGAKNPKAITATRLRKHLATLTQVLNMSDNDIEQLSTFMGHTVNVHRGSYRLPDDVFQTAKISKLLMLMEKGEAAQYKGKSLDEINVNLDTNIEESDSEQDNQDAPDNLADMPNLSIPSMPECEATTSGEFNKQTKKTKRLLVPWTDEQKEVARNFFAAHIKTKQPPKKHECVALKEKYGMLFTNKDWLKIKVFVQNEYNKKGR